MDVPYSVLCFLCRRCLFAQLVSSLFVCTVPYSVLCFLRRRCFFAQLVSSLFDHHRRDRKHTHTSLFLDGLFLASRVPGNGNGGRRNRVDPLAQATRIQLDDDYMLLLWKHDDEPKRICDIFWLKKSHARWIHIIYYVRGGVGLLRQQCFGNICFLGKRKKEQLWDPRIWSKLILCKLSIAACEWHYYVQYSSEYRETYRYPVPGENLKFRVIHGYQISFMTLQQLFNNSRWKLVPTFGTHLVTNRKANKK